MEGVPPPPKASDVDPGVDLFLGADPRWFCHHSAIIAYEDEHIVSYRSGFYGVPVPQTPLFTKDGIWCFWGDYAIVHGHAYELNGAFPSLFIPWRDPTCGGLLPGNREAIERLLTAKARSSLGLDKPKANW